MNQFSGYASQAVSVAINVSTKLVDQTVEAAKGAIERNNSYLQSLKDAKTPDSFLRIGDIAAKQEAAAAEEYFRTACGVAAEAATEVAELADAGREAADKLFVEQVQVAVDAIPEGQPNPFGDMVKDAARTQLDAYRAVAGAYSAAVKSGRANFTEVANGAADAVERATKVGTARRPRKAK